MELLELTSPTACVWLFKLRPDVLSKTLLDFGDTPYKLKGEYLDMYDGIKSDALSTTKFDENSDFSTTYLGRINMTRLDQIRTEEKCPILEHGYTVGNLVDDMECQILLDTGASVV